MRKQSDCVCFLHRYMIPRTSPTQPRRFVKIKVHADQDDSGPARAIVQVGSSIASSGGTVDGLEPGSGLESGSGMNASGTSRRVERVVRRINENIKRAESGGYTDPRFKLWLDSRNQPNTQRARWQESLTTVLAMETGADIAEDKEEPREEENPLKPDTYHLEGEFAALNRIYDVTVEGIRIEEQLEFGSLLKAYLEEHGEGLSESFREAFNNISNQQNVTAYIKGGEGKWAVLKGSADQVAVNTSNLLNGDTTVLTSEGSSVLPASEEPETAKSQNYFQRSIKQVFLGNYSDDVTVMGTGMQIALGIINADMPADIRDIVYDIQNWELSAGHISKTLLDGIGFIPVIGAIKYGDEVSVLIRAGNNGEVARLTGRINDAVLDTVSKERKEIGNVINSTENSVAKVILDSGNRHLLKDHVRQTLEQLKDQLKNKPNAPAATSFVDEAKGLEYTSNALRRLENQILEWVKKEGNNMQAKGFEIDMDEVVGYGIKRDSELLANTKRINVVVKPNGTGGYEFVDAYPIFPK